MPFIDIAFNKLPSFFIINGALPLAEYYISRAEMWPMFFWLRIRDWEALRPFKIWSSA